jgi:photosystem II stability/assembly factor-like uncharacterized protein
MRKRNHNIITSLLLIAVMLSLVGCKPGRPQFAMPEIKMITGENLHSVVAFTPEEVMVCGSYGAVYFTNSGGGDIKEWQPQVSGVGDTLLCEATFVSRQRGWVVGTKGTIISTSDGGKSWKQQESGTEKNLFSVAFVDASNGWAVGEFGTIIHSADGGESWTFQAESIDKMLNGVCFVDAMHGWVVGEFGTILHTADGGGSWETQRCEAIETKVGLDSYDWKPMPALYEVHFEDVNRGWIVGMDGIILKTEDGGKLWRKIETGCEVPLYSIEIKGRKGWVVGSRGYYLISEDGGESWAVKDEVIKTRFWLRDVSFSDMDNGWIVGAMGAAARTTDGGVSWELISGIRYDMKEYGLVDF